MVTARIGGKSLSFMVDNRAESSVATQLLLPAPFTSWQIQVISATGALTENKFSQRKSCTFGGHFIKHEFLYMPEFPFPLLEHDLLSRLGATISFTPNQLVLPLTVSAVSDHTLRGRMVFTSH